MEKETLENKIRALLRQYFETDDNGNTNPEFNDTYTAQDFVDDVHNLIGNI